MQRLTIIILILGVLLACGKEEKESTRCRSADEARMKCQVEYAEKFHVLIIPENIKSQCNNFYPSPGCYYDSSKRYYW